MTEDSPPTGAPPEGLGGRVETTAMDPAGVSRARHLVVEQLRVWRCAAPDDTALVLSELATNAVIHAGGAVRIAVTHDADRVRMEVHDSRTEPPHLQPHTPEPGGLGLHIVARLSHDWGSQPTTTGKYVWAVMACAHSEPPPGPLTSGT